MLSFLLHAWRSWKSAKGVALLAVVALAIGIGSTTAIYTVIRAVLLNPLPYQQADRFVSLFSARFSEPGQRGASSNLDLIDYQQRNRSFDVFGWFGLNDYNLTAPGVPQLVKGLEVSPSLIGNLGVQPMMGRWFQDAATEHGSVYLAVISANLWHRLGSDPDIVGRQITLDHHPYTITGVAPGWFRMPVSDGSATIERYDVWVPLHPQGSNLRRDVAPYFCYARRKPGVTFAQADADVKRVAAEIAREHPADHLQYTATLIGLKDSVVQDIRPTLLLLLGAAAALLLITCANVAGLLLARSVGRARETAVRVALGASRRQLAGQYFFEGLLLAIAGAVCGIFVSFALVKVVVSLAAEEIPRADEIATDWSVLLVALGVAVVSSMLFSLAPLWQAIRTLPSEVLTEGVRASAGARSKGLSRVLVIAEIALAFTLVAVGALLLAQLGRLIRVSPGFDPDHVLTFQVNAGDSEYSDVKLLHPYQNRLLQAVERIPGVASAGFVNQLPLDGCCLSTSLVPEGRPPDQKVERVSFLPVSLAYFRTLRIPLIQGRYFNATDGTGDLVVIIDQAMARRYWPGLNPVGAYARIAEGGDRFQVIGVVGDVKNDGLSKATVPELYFPSRNAPVNPMRWVVRSTLPPETLINQVRRAIQNVNPAQPVYAVRTMNEIVQSSVGAQRLQSFMVSFFAAAALLMAILGVYGVVSYSVRQRTVEIGTRMAIGATSRDLLRLIVGDGLKMAVLGILAGGAGVAAVMLLLRSSDFAVPVESPLPLLFATVGIAALTAAACFIPAWRATLISPLVAIRNEPGSMWQATRLGFLHVAEQFSGLLHSEDEQAAASECELLAEIADAGRNAGSFADAIQAALKQLRERIGAESLALFVQRGPGQPYRCNGVVPDACVDAWVLPSGALIVNRLRHYAGALPVDRVALDAAARWAAEVAPEHLEEIALLRELGAALAVRVAVKSEVSGILFVGKPQGRAEYTALEKRLLRGVSAQFAMMVENGRLTDRIVEQERLRRELLVAGEVQKRLFPDKWPDSSGLQLTGVCLPARGVGGDYYDFIDLGGESIGIALADVAGKGIAAALIMSVVQASLRSLAEKAAEHAGASLAELTTKMNRLLHRSTGSNSYATFFYAQVDQTHDHSARRMRYVNAGHNPPYLLRGGRIDELTVGGTIIGMFAKSGYEEGVVDLLPGDMLLAFTDGVPEALNPAEEEYGEERLKEALIRYAGLAVDEMAARLLQDLREWIADAAQYDDLTFIVMKVS